MVSSAAHIQQPGELVDADRISISGGGSIECRGASHRTSHAKMLSVEGVSLVVDRFEVLISGENGISNRSASTGRKSSGGYRSGGSGGSSGTCSVNCSRHQANGNHEGAEDSAGCGRRMYSSVTHVVMPTRSTYRASITDGAWVQDHACHRDHPGRCVHGPQGQHPLSRSVNRTVDRTV